MKIFASITLSLILVMNYAAMGAVTTPMTTDRGMDLVDQYIQDSRKPQNTQDPKAALFERMARSAYLAKIVGTQLMTMEPEDFNNFFVLNLMDRYVNVPAHRELLFKLIQTLEEIMKPDLENTKLVAEGPLHFLVSGSYSYLTWVLIGGMLGWRGLMKIQGVRTNALIGEIRIRNANLANRYRIYRYAGKVIKRPLLWTAGAGVGIGYVDYLLQSHRTHRLNPAEILKVVQSQLACQLSYEALELMDKVDAAIADEDHLDATAAPLRIELAVMIAHAKELRVQFPRLAELDVKDRLFQDILKVVPQAKNFQEYRQMLSEAETSGDGQCRQISLDSMVIKLDEVQNNLNILSGAGMPPVTPGGEGPP